MLQADDSRRKPLKEACCSLLIIAIGFISCSIIGALAYFTFRAAAGNMSFCTLWTDIPGRLAIFLMFYYVAGICGTLPIPESFRMNFLPPPFVFYRLESWKSLFRKLRRLFTFNCQMYEVIGNDPEMSPLHNEGNAFSYLSPATRERSENIRIAETDIHRRKPSLSKNKSAARSRDVEIGGNSEEHSMSLDSSMRGPIVPMARGNRTKPNYFTDSTISTTEASSQSISKDPIEILFNFSGTLNDQTKTSVKVLSETDTTPPRTPDVVLPSRRLPRIPWGLLEHRNGHTKIPKEAKALHKRNLTEEWLEQEEYNKKQRMDETLHSPKGDDSDGRTDSDGLNLSAHPQSRLPLVTARSKRARTKTTPIHVSGKSKLKIHKRMLSCSAPHRNPFGESSPDLQDKVKYIKKTCMKLGQRFQASTSKQCTAAFPSKKSDGEASTSRQNVDYFSFKISDSEASIAGENIETLPRKIPDGEKSDTTSSKKSDSEISTNRRYIGRMYECIPSKSCDSNDESAVTSVQTKSSENEASVAGKNIETFPGKISDSEILTSGQSDTTSSSKKPDSETSTNRQYIGRMYENFPSKNCDSNDESAATSDQTKFSETLDE